MIVLIWLLRAIVWPVMFALFFAAVLAKAWNDDREEERLARRQWRKEPGDQLGLVARLPR